MLRALTVGRGRGTASRDDERAEPRHAEPGPADEPAPHRGRYGQVDGAPRRLERRGRRPGRRAASRPGSPRACTGRGAGFAELVWRVCGDLALDEAAGAGALEPRAGGAAPRPVSSAGGRRQRARA
eukprot:3481197-Rhodomonas_salina.1